MVAVTLARPSHVTLPSATHVEIQYGHHTARIPYTRVGNALQIVLTSAIRDALQYPTFPTGVRWDGETVRLGPAVAIYAFLFPGKRLFGPQTQLFLDLAQMARDRGVDLYVMTPGDVRPAQGVTMGYRIDEYGRQFVRTVCPWPDYLIRRTTTRPLPLRKTLAREEEILRSTTVHGTLARRDCEKQQMFKILSQNPIVAPYILPMMATARADAILHMLSEYPDVYVKPARGTQGQRIVRIVAEAGGYRWSADKGDRDVLLSASALVHRLSGLFRGPERYIAQKTVSLMTTEDNRPFDVRCLVQARPAAPPVCTATMLRVAPSGSVTTNLHTGAMPIRRSELEASLSPQKREVLRRALDDAETLSCAAFATFAALQPSLAELGVDIAVDQSGEPYILEVNACPGRKMFRYADPAARRLSLARLLEYAVFSTGFGSADAERGRAHSHGNPDHALR